MTIKTDLIEMSEKYREAMQRIADLEHDIGVYAKVTNYLMGKNWNPSQLSYVQQMLRKMKL
jgi:hypothetical protein